jgi:hypothetical protein
MTFETVIVETPASSATSDMLALRRPRVDSPLTRRLPSVFLSRYREGFYA